MDVPRDLTVAGFDDSTAAVTLWPPLTTIRQPVRALAAEAMQRLIQAMRTGPSAAEVAGKTCILDHLLVERESTAAPA
jgi:LacI family transcriptional regulator